MILYAFPQWKRESFGKTHQQLLKIKRGSGNGGAKEGNEEDRGAETKKK